MLQITPVELWNQALTVDKRLFRDVEEPRRDSLTMRRKTNCSVRSFWEKGERKEKKRSRLLAGQLNIQRNYLVAVDGFSRPFTAYYSHYSSFPFLAEIPSTPRDEITSSRHKVHARGRFRIASLAHDPRSSRETYSLCYLFPIRWYFR